MAQEIERKFLVKGNFKPEVFKSTRIMQGGTGHKKLYEFGLLPII